MIEEAFTISAGLDYPGIGPMHADLATRGRSHVLAIKDDEAIYAGYELTRMEGIIPAIESAHAVAALKKMKFKKDDVVVLTVSGRGDKDVERAKDKLVENAREINGVKVVTAVLPMEPAAANHDYQRPNIGTRNTPDQLKVAMTFFLTMPGIPTNGGKWVILLKIGTKIKPPTPNQNTALR